LTRRWWRSTSVVTGGREDDERQPEGKAGGVMPKCKKNNTVLSYESLARLREMLSLRNLADRTREAYLVYIQKLALRTGRDPALLDEAQAREYLLYLKEKRRYAPSSMRTVCAALRF